MELRMPLSVQLSEVDSGIQFDYTLSREKSQVPSYYLLIAVVLSCVLFVVGVIATGNSAVVAILCITSAMLMLFFGLFMHSKNKQPAVEDKTIVLKSLPGSISYHTAIKMLDTVELLNEGHPVKNGVEKFFVILANIDPKSVEDEIVSSKILYIFSSILYSHVNPTTDFSQDTFLLDAEKTMYELLTK